MEDQNWYTIASTKNIVTPALMVYPDRIVKNIEKMIAIAGGTEMLRPHIKTHKMAEVIALQLQFGIRKFKCATIAEAELLAKCGAKDILLAMQPVAININRFFELITAYPNTCFSTLVDNSTSVKNLSEIAVARNTTINLWLDIDCGMHRTGIAPEGEAIVVYKAIIKATQLVAKGFHVYDGHIHDEDIEERKKTCAIAFAPVLELKNKLQKEGIKIETIIAGGTPTFPIFASREGIETSPGTPLLWDAGYGSNYKDLDFLPAAVLLTRVVSKPKTNLVCFDLGHKAVASEMPLPRVQFLTPNKANQISQSEEHLVVETAEELEIGEVCYAVPIHICPTVSKYKSVLTVENGSVSGSWDVAARDHKMTI
ncbi:MAG: D-TA family PLP-dependent enzyme [Cellulophaga sp.]